MATRNILSLIRARDIQPCPSGDFSVKVSWRFDVTGDRFETPFVDFNIHVAVFGWGTDNNVVMRTHNDQVIFTNQRDATMFYMTFA